MGRKPISSKRKSETPLRIRLDEDERAKIDAKATSEGKKSSAWARDVLLAAAEPPPKPPKKSRRPKHDPAPDR